MPADSPHSPHDSPEALRAPQRRVNLALQGGGSHGAFTWGVLDALLEDGRVGVDGISGASAGAVNAVALAHGFAVAHERGTSAADEAREALRRVWQGVMAAGSLSAMNQNFMGLAPFSSLWPNPANMMAGALQQWTSPYQLNPLDLNPLRALLRREIDFEAIGRLRKHRVFISATHVHTGKAAIFTGREISLQAVLASTCLPQIFQAVEIGGDAYWDGGYVGNPPLTPLIEHCESADILLVQINPVVRDEVPTTQADIVDRVNEITFNASLLTQMRMIGFINRQIELGRLPQPEFRQILVHRIDGGEALKEYNATSKLSVDAAMLERLFKHGRTSARNWLRLHAHDVGARSTVPLGMDYADDMVIHG